MTPSDDEGLREESTSELEKTVRAMFTTSDPKRQYYLDDMTIDNLMALISQKITEERVELQQALYALGSMYAQYCNRPYGHDFMGAGESAIEILERYGLAQEDIGVDEIKLDELERSLTTKQDTMEKSSE